MKALSIRQPWASRIADGRKRLEVRSRQTRYRGELLICSSGVRVRGAVGPLGMALAIVRLVDCRRMVEADAVAAGVPFQEGAFVWELADVRPLLKPFPVRGHLNFFDVLLSSSAAAVSAADQVNARAALPATCGRSEAGERNGGQ